MGGVPSLASAVILALIPPREQAKNQADGSTTNVVVRRATVTGTSELKTFLRMNPEEGFDIEAINAIDTHALLKEARDDKRLLREAVRTAEELIPRVRAETEDPLLVGAILSDKTLTWYRKSAADPDWAEFTPLRWGGIFYASRVPGGRLRRRLSTRLVDLINDCVNASGTTAVLRAGFGGMFRGSKNVKGVLKFALGSKRPRLTQQVAQAYLDDLAANPRSGEATVPLEHLSDVAKRNGSAEVNNTLAELFHPENNKSLIVVDPRFHPGMNALILRVVPAKNPGEPSTYDLIQSEPGRAREPSATRETASDAAATSPWERQGLTDKDWVKILKSLEKRKARLEAPPAENHRERGSYLSLRELVMTDGPARKAFLVVHWKGRPSGLTLLAQLLSQGTLAPEVDTDGDYLEAELDHLDVQKATRGANVGSWTIGHGWTVTREIRPGAVRVYAARGGSDD
jgi:hypothetical protein